MQTFNDLRKINVDAHIEKKNGLSYLSWAAAVDELLQACPTATWEYGTPEIYSNTMMVFCTVHAFGVQRTCQLPVMDFKNKSISNPDSFQVNTAMQRCLAKTIALHGIGLYIYKNEDVPVDSSPPEVAPTLGKNLANALERNDKKITEEYAIMVPSATAEQGEAACVDFISTFAEEFIGGIETVDGLRQFWKINKAQLSRVKTFSAPMYKSLETAFKQRAKKLELQILDSRLPELDSRPVERVVEVEVK